MFESWVLNEIYIIDLSSALVGMLLSSSKLFPLSEEVIVIGCVCGFGFEQKFWRIDGLGAKRHGSADLHTPIQPPHSLVLDKILVWLHRVLFSVFS